MPYLVGVTSLFWIFNMQIVYYLTPFRRRKMCEISESIFRRLLSTLSMHVLGFRHIATFRSQMASKAIGLKNRCDILYLWPHKMGEGGRDELVNFIIRHRTKLIIYFWRGAVRPSVGDYSD